MIWRNIAVSFTQQWPFGGSGQGLGEKRLHRGAPPAFDRRALTVGSFRFGPLEVAHGPRNTCSDWLDGEVSPEFR